MSLNLFSKLVVLIIPVMWYFSGELVWILHLKWFYWETHYGSAGNVCCACLIDNAFSRKDDVSMAVQCIVGCVQEPFVQACAGFLVIRCPQLVGKDDQTTQSKSHQLPAETIGTVLACLQACCPYVFTSTLLLHCMSKWQILSMSWEWRTLAFHVKLENSC